MSWKFWRAWVIELDGAPMTHTIQMRRSAAWAEVGLASNVARLRRHGYRAVRVVVRALEADPGRQAAFAPEGEPDGPFCHQCGMPRYGTPCVSCGNDEESDREHAAPVPGDKKPVNWVNEVLDRAVRTVRDYPAWMRRPEFSAPALGEGARSAVAGAEYADNIDLQREISRLQARLKRTAKIASEYQAERDQARVLLLEAETERDLARAALPATDRVHDFTIRRLAAERDIALRDLREAVGLIGDGWDSALGADALAAWNRLRVAYLRRITASLQGAGPEPASGPCPPGPTVPPPGREEEKP